MKKLLGVNLGVITAMGGFVDIGDIVANAETGARFGMSLTWAVVLGVVGICVFAEMSGAGRGGVGPAGIRPGARAAGRRHRPGQPVRLVLHHPAHAGRRGRRPGPGQRVPWDDVVAVEPGRLVVRARPRG
jgi:hypothetical protein